MKPRTAVVVVVAAVTVWWLVRRGTVTPTAASGFDLAALARQVLNAIGGWASEGAAWVAARPGPLIGFAALVVVAAALRAARRRQAVPQDPQRMYTSEQRAEAFSRAGGRCEYTGFLLSRCPRPAEHADHLIPWSKGGATTLENCVASCAHHNTSKGATLLPRWRVRVLERRRRRYFPPGVDVRVGERFIDRVVA